MSEVLLSSSHEEVQGQQTCRQSFSLQSKDEKPLPNLHAIVHAKGLLLESVLERLVLHLGPVSDCVQSY